MAKPDYMTDKEWNIYYEDSLQSHGVTPDTLDKIFELIKEDMKIRGVKKEEHQIGKYKTVVEIYDEALLE